MDPSNVPFFQRPMSARDSDKPTGNVDEAGNREFITSTHTRYFVKPNADQRTTRTKIKEDVVPAVKEFAANPSLPSAEQMKQFGSAVVESTVEGIKGAVEGTGTMGDAFSVVPAMGVASAPFKVPEGALRLFGGPKAKKANQESLKEFVKSYRGKSSEEIEGLWKTTGWGKNAQGEPRFEIDDSNFKYVGTPEPRQYYDLDQVIEHKELFDNYPQLRGIKISEQTGFDPNEIMGEMRFLSDNTPYIMIASDLTPDEKRLVVLHELQHVIQATEDRNFHSRSSNDWEGLSYQNRPEEIEAFATEPRIDMTPEQRREKMPNFARGGSVDKQMKTFNEGGLADDGLDIDPVSGNEIPPGSMAEEVEDDVDAKLSKGEYVVPADVVRFFGVDYFEKLRKKAKEGLAEMESDGRIGGEPIDEEGDDLPFSDEELMSMEEASGVEAPVGMAAGGAVGGFAEGLNDGMELSGTVKTKRYRNSDGEERTVMFIGDQPIQQIPSGFTLIAEDDKTKPEQMENEDNKPDPERGNDVSGTEANPGGGENSGGALGSFADAITGAISGAIGSVFGGSGTGPAAAGGYGGGSGNAAEFGGTGDGSVGFGGPEGGPSSSAGVGSGAEGPGGMGMWNEGGLVKRPNKKTKPKRKALVQRRTK